MLSDGSRRSVLLPKGSGQLVLLPWPTACLVQLANRGGYTPYLCSNFLCLKRLTSSREQGRHAGLAGALFQSGCAAVSTHALPLQRVILQIHCQRSGSAWRIMLLSGTILVRCCAERPAHSVTPACGPAPTAGPVAAQEGLDIAGRYSSSKEAAAALVQRSRERWATIQSGLTCDDVTAIVCRLH